jgi:hypothetical protein
VTRGLSGDCAKLEKETSLMRALLISSAFVALSAFSAVAAPAADLPSQFKAVCSSKAHLSEHLAAACKGAAPEGIKDGSRFKAQGIGAELNTLYANIAFFGENEANQN